MDVVLTLSNHYKYQKAKKLIDLSADTLIIILMDTGFAFDADADATLADVTADQIATGYGYTQDTKALANLVLTEDDANNRAYMSCDDPSWTASGAALPSVGAAIIYDDDTADDTVIGCIDFGVNYTTSDGTTFKIEDIIIAEE